MTRSGQIAAPLGDRLIGARIVDVREQDAGRALTIEFEHRGTDDDAGYLIVPLTGVYFKDGDA